MTKIFFGSVYYDHKDISKIAVNDNKWP